MSADEPEDDPGEHATVNAEDISWRDYVAIAIALAQTVLLPFLLASAFLFLLFLLSIYVI